MARILYIECNSGKNSGSFLIDIDTREAPEMPNANEMTFRFGCFDFEPARDLSEFTTINLMIRESQTDDGAAFYDQDIAGGDITNTITTSAWNNKTAWHIDHDVAGASLNYSLGTRSTVELWMVLTGTDAGGEETTLGAGAFWINADNNYNPDGSVYMLKSTYDTDNNGIVDEAESAQSADAVAYANITGTPTTFAPTAHAAAHEIAGADLITHDNLTGSGTNTHAQIDTAVSASTTHIADATKHRIINDSGTLTTELFSASKIIADLAGKKATFSENTAFNKNFGTGSGTVCEGDDSRLVTSDGEYQSFPVPMGSFVGDGGAAPTFARGSSNPAGWIFTDSGTTDYITGTIRIPDDCAHATAIKIKLLMRDPGTSGDFDIYIGGLFHDDGDTYADPSSMTKISDSFVGTTNLLVELAAHSLGAPGGVGKWLTLKIQRTSTGTDTLADEARLIGASIQYLIDVDASTVW